MISKREQLRDGGRLYGVGPGWDMVDDTPPPKAKFAPPDPPPDNPETDVTELDLRDPLVQEMVRRDHLPHEEWSMAGKLLFVNCQTCGQDWPCLSVRTLRQTLPRDLKFGKPYKQYPEEEESPCPDCNSLDRTVVPARFRSRGPFCDNDWHDSDPLPQPGTPAMNLLIHDNTASP